ncbi:MAG: response regulator [Candidatus Omnitrophota bacterium]|nr:response regulator [Candidatus Omnitrophota bacterium]
MKILLADDEIRIVTLVRKFLKQRGLPADLASDGKEALELIKKHDYDLIFLDINMPELTGLDILKYIKENKIGAVVVLLTGYPGVDKNFCKALGADEYLEKPVDLKAIGDIIDKYTK